MIFETHAHYEDEQFDGDRDLLLEELPKQGISPVINVGSTLETSRKSIQLSQQYAFIYAAIGIHPSEPQDMNEETYSWLRSQFKDPKVLAIGEIGLDYYWPKKDYEAAVKEHPEQEAAQKELLAKELENQKYWFGRQLDLAKETGLPVVIHSRDAAEDTYRLMSEKKLREIGGVVHCFSYSLEMARRFIDLGFYIGIGGVLTFKNAKKLKEVAKNIPLDRIVLETDCPYMAPEPHRGKRNSSLYLPYVVSKLAELRGISEEEVSSVTYENAARLYHYKEI